MRKAIKVSLTLVKIVLVLGFMLGIICFFSEAPETSGFWSQIKLWLAGIVICLMCSTVLIFIEYKEES